MFSCEFSSIVKNDYFAEHLWVSASGHWKVMRKNLASKSEMSFSEILSPKRVRKILGVIRSSIL